MRLNDHVAPACFPEESDNLEETFPPEMTCIVTGWGATDPEWLVRGPVLKQSYAQLYSMEQCRQWIDPDWLTDRMLCAGNQEMMDSTILLKHHLRISADRI